MASSTPRRSVVARVADIPPDQRLLVARSIGVFNTRGTFYTVRNSCPREGGPLCLGPTVGLATSSRPGDIAYSREGEILRCPWHGWKFDLATRRSVFGPTRTSVRSYPIEIERGQVVVIVS